MFRMHEGAVCRRAAIKDRSDSTNGRTQVSIFPTVKYGDSATILGFDDKRFVQNSGVGIKTKLSHVTSGRVSKPKGVTSRGNAVREKLEPYVVQDGTGYRTVLLPRDLKNSLEEIDREYNALSGNIDTRNSDVNDNLATQNELKEEETRSPLAAALAVSSFAGFLAGCAVFMLGGSWRLTLGTYFLIALLPVIATVLWLIRR